MQRARYIHRMSKRLQVVLNDAEYRGLQRLARRDGMTVSEWVRQALRAVRKREPQVDDSRKLQAVREATRHSYPTGDITEILTDIEAGRGGEGT